MREHELKIEAEFFEAQLQGNKNFELRKDDRGFNVGDSIVLREITPQKTEPQPRYTGRKLLTKITFMLRHTQAEGLKKNHVILGTKVFGYTN